MGFTVEFMELHKCLLPTEIQTHSILNLWKIQESSLYIHASVVQRVICPQKYGPIPVSSPLTSPFPSSTPTYKVWHDCLFDGDGSLKLCDCLSGC